VIRRLIANATVAGVVAGLPAPVSTTSLSTGVVDLAGKVAALEAALAAEKAARADDAVKATAAATDAATKAAAAADAATKAIAELNAKIAVLTKNVASIKAKYNALAKKHKKPLIK
jgi:hypothetical protein